MHCAFWCVLYKRSQPPKNCLGATSLCAVIYIPLCKLVSDMRHTTTNYVVDLGMVLEQEVSPNA